jgi:hypothetical protein
VSKSGPRAAAVARQQATSASKDFPKSTLSALTKRGIRLVGTTWLPGPGGSYANGERGYLVDDNGTGKVWSYLQVAAIGSR